MLRSATSLATVFVFVFGGAAARGQTVNANPSNTSSTETVVTVTVTPAAGTTMKDFHFRPDKKAKLAAATINGLPSGWSGSAETNDGINVTTSGSGITNDSSNPDPDSLTFTLTYSHAAGKPPTSSSVFWAITNDGNNTIGNGSPETKNPIGPNKTKPSDVVDWGGPGMTGSGPQLPIAGIAFRGEATGTAIIGSDIPLALVTSVADHVYSVNTALALDSNSDLGIDINSPLPSTLGITLSPDRGGFEEDANGRIIATPLIRLPNNSGLVGQVIYVVVTLDLDGNGTPDVRTSVRRITVQNTGATGNAIEDVD